MRMSILRELSLQLQIEKYIISSQERGNLPLRAVVYVDIINMFNSLSRANILLIIQDDYSDLYPMVYPMYSQSKVCHLRWSDGSWRQMEMEVG